MPSDNVQQVGFATARDTIFLYRIRMLLDAIKLSFADESFGSASVTDPTTTQSDPNDLTSTDVTPGDADSVTSVDADEVTSADADDTYGTEERPY